MVFDCENGLAGFQRGVREEPDLSPEALVMGIPGTVSRDRQQVLNCPNAPELECPELPGQLSAALGIPVFLERDVNLLLLCDMQVFGTGGLVIGLYFGTGLGNAVAIDGMLSCNMNHFFSSEL